MADTRCRFAPSPTGHLHIGGVRTALFNWLFARNTGGKFILRIEDTDTERNDADAAEGILKSLRWLGLNWDEGPYFQSERRDCYREAAGKLLDAGLAYEEKTEKGTALRFRMPREDFQFDDTVYGSITFPADKMEDLVIMKSNGMPTYNFACVVDDHEMEITHVIRGDDHIANTPKQMLVCGALGWKRPVFAHVPMIHGEDGSKLSKRHGASSALEFKREGYLPDALLNFVALLGWSPGDDREIMSVEEIIASFSLDRIKKTSAIFNREKLDWMNGQYIMMKPAADIVEPMMEILCERDIDTGALDRGRLETLIGLYSERMKRLSDLPVSAAYFFGDVNYDEKAVDDVLRKEGVNGLLSGTADRLETCGGWSIEEIERVLRAFAEEAGVKFGALGQPIRVAVTGGRKSPGIFETLALLGRERSVARLRAAAAMV